jgi:hypothetical protein
VNEEALN